MFSRSFLRKKTDEMTSAGDETAEETAVEKSRKTLIVGSRESLLAVRQSKIVMEYVEENCPGIRCELVTMKTTGDRIMGRLDRIGGKGLFVKELDQALRDGRIDLSVHSLKDMPMETAPELPVVAFSPREDPRDVLVLPAGCEAFAAKGAIPSAAGVSVKEGQKTGAGGGLQAERISLKELSRQLDLSKPIGTSSRRRTLQLQSLFSEVCPQVRFESVRGNVQTRLRKLDEGQYSALILAAAGLHRLNLEDRISFYFGVDEIIPSAGQGILALQGREGKDYSCLQGFACRESAMAAEAERAFVRALGGGCTSPIASHAAFEDGIMTLRGFYYDDSLGKGVRRSLTKRISSMEECRAAGAELAALVLGECR